MELLAGLAVFVGAILAMGGVVGYVVWDWLRPRPIGELPEIPGLSRGFVDPQLDAILREPVTTPRPSRPRRRRAR
jgi:hypothetical protein